MAWSYLWYDWDFDEAENSYSETKRVYPNYSWTDFLLATGRYEEAYKGSLRNIEADSPNSLSVTGMIVSSYFAERSPLEYIDRIMTTQIIRDDLLVRMEAGRMWWKKKRRKAKCRGEQSCT